MLWFARSVPGPLGADDRNNGMTVFPLKTKLTFPGLRKLLLPLRPNSNSTDTAATRARALFLPPESAITTRRGSLVEFLGRVSLFEDLGRRDLVRLAHIVHERDYADGDYICEEGRPGAALFVVRQGVVEVVGHGADTQEVPLALLEPPASFEESAAIGTGGIRWFSVRARGPVSLLALGKSDLDALIINFPVLANKVLIRLAGIMAIRLQMLIDSEIFRDSEEHDEGKP
jgi:CRP-like cAMP-binding protein